MRRPTGSAALVVADSLVWGAWSLTVGYAFHRLSPDRLASDNALTRLRPWERQGRAWVRLGVRRWKSRLPEAGAFFAGGVDKRRLPSSQTADLRRFVVETRRAELVHWTVPVLAPAFFLWNPPPLALGMVGFAAVANVPCLVVQRYNRGRVLQLLARRQARSAAPR